MKETDGGPALSPGDAGQQSRARRGGLLLPGYVLNLVLLLATFFTTTWAGTYAIHGSKDIGFFSLGQLLPLFASGLRYSLSIMGILIAHEMGHYLVARRHGLAASLPYFLPVPLPMVGTMGAVIVMRGPKPERNALVDWAAAGPLAGLLVAIPVLWVGIAGSPVGPVVEYGQLEGNSLLYLLIKFVIKGQVLPGHGVDVHLQPMAWAGWLGLLVTMINLMPIGQLDGGHLAFAFFGNRFERYSRVIHYALSGLSILVIAYVTADLSNKHALPEALAFGGSAGLPWMLWFGLLHLMRLLSRGAYHPPIGGESLTFGRKALCVLIMAVFVLIFVPIPFRTT